MSDASSDDRDAFLKRYEAQTEAALAQTDFWRRLAKWAIGILVVVGAALAALAIVIVLIARSTHDDGTVTRNKADQTLGIARTFLCEQQPTPKGCPPQPPQPAVSPSIQAIINEVITRIEQLYPPPNGLR